ncbi:MAG: NosD domain-containing protein, partial [Methanosarcina sp.]
IFNADIGNKRNAWNIKRTEGTNIVGGPYLGGNFWASPDGTGFSETALDANGNGIADLKYNGTNYTDYLPLVPVFDPQKQILPAVNVSTSVTNVTVSKTVTDIPTDPVPTKSGSSDDNAT